jgi:hypothetical protein
VRTGLVELAVRRVLLRVPQSLLAAQEVLGLLAEELGRERDER